MPYQVAVCGPHDCTPQERDNAHRIGRLLAERGVTVICGGGGGVMAAVAAGAHAGNGCVIGIRGDDTRDGAAPELSVTLVTNMGQARNAIIVWSADAVIVVGGSWGTLSEVALARRRGGVPVVSLDGWRILDQDGRPLPGITDVATPEEAVATALARRERSIMSSPPITADGWGSITVEGRQFKDVKLWPGGARAWDWTETGTDHDSGVRPDDVRELLRHGAHHVVLSRGREGRLRVHPDTEALLDEVGVAHDILPTDEAIARYERLREAGTAVGALLHTTC